MACYACAKANERWLYMCGIVGYVGNKTKCLSVLKQGLINLEYRGYDSAGITFFKRKSFKTIKSVGAPAELFNKVNLSELSLSGIAHTRWATHGKVTEANAHPHLSAGGLVSVVHNGIIENFNEIKKTLLSDVKFKSTTDSEVIPNLIERFYKGNEISAIRQAIKKLKGCFALAILFKGNPQTIYYARKNMSLLVGYGEGEMFVSSDISAFSGYTKKYAVLPNNSCGFVTSSEVKAYNFAGKELKLEKQEILEKNRQVSRGKFNYYMEKEIYEIKDVLKNTFKAYDNNLLNHIDPSFFSGIKYIKILACGTSFHAGLVGQKLFEQSGIMANAEIASEFIYNKPLLPKGTLAIFVSQSGETADTISAIKVAKSLGAKTLGITNVKHSAVDKLCDATLYLEAGVERGVASTKAYNTQLLVFYLLNNFLSKKCSHEQFKTNFLNNLNKLNVSKLHSEVKPLASIIKDASNIFVVGRNFDYVTSEEASLKVKEITYINSQSYAAGELKHGTLALVDERTILIAFITERALIDKTLNIVMETRSRGAKVIIVTPFNLKKLISNSDFIIKLPNFAEEFMPIFAIVPIQLLALETSLALGHNPDKPRNLAKSVTVE